MRSSTFRNVALGILALAAAYHLGARRSQASIGAGIVGYTAFSNLNGEFITADGDLYYYDGGNGVVLSRQYRGNVWAPNGPTPVETQSLGQIKSRYAR